MCERIRLLKAEEIECKIGSINENGCSLLLYKTARTDMDILDEVYGPENWQDTYREIKGVLYCTISVYNEKLQEWVGKEDCGVESAFGDKEKGEASDAFKRAGTRWGIGRELYTAPFIWVNKDKVNLFVTKRTDKYGNPIYSTYDNFFVKEVGYDDRRKINMLVIVNQKNEEVYRYGKQPKKQPEKQPEKQIEKQPIIITKGTLQQINIVVHNYAELVGKTDEEVMAVIIDKYNIANIEKISNDDGMKLVKVVTGWVQQTKKENQKETVNQ